MIWQILSADVKQKTWQDCNCLKIGKKGEQLVLQKRKYRTKYFHIASLKFSSASCHWENRELTWICRALVLNLEIFFSPFAFLDCPALPAAPTFLALCPQPWLEELISTSPLGNGNRTYSASSLAHHPLWQQPQQQQEAAAPILILGSGKQLWEEKHFWKHILIKIWGNIRGGAQGGVFNGTLGDLFSVEQRHAQE